jgi:hypothetical protein
MKIMKTNKYSKPAVTRAGSTPEPVEAGCCLRSCGGKPSPQGGAFRPKSKLGRKLSDLRKG